jgi:hypothetical protein
MIKTIRSPIESERGDHDEIERRSAQTLAKLLATPPDHKQSAQAKANPKKRGRPKQRGEPPKS